MDLSDVVSVRKFLEFDEEQKEELYETLLELAQAVEEIPKKSLRKSLDIALAVLQYKGEQVERLQEQVESPDDSQSDRLRDENEKLKRMLEKLESEKQSCKNKIKELTDEIFLLQQRLQDAAHPGEASDKDSSDPLSELDKQEELLKNINSKNKHIKRLLKEIEALQTQNIEQSKAIIESEKQLQQTKVKVLQLSADITLVDSERKALKETVNELQVEISRLESNVTYLEEEREKGEKDLKDFIKKLEAKAQSWKQLLDEKDVELKKLRTRLDAAKQYTSSVSSAESDAKSSDENKKTAENARETTQLLHAIECRDKLIEQLELKIKTMAEEMLATTKLMNKLSAERQDERDIHKPRACCKLLEESVQAANARCRDLSELLERSEEDNALKSKQALQAVMALDAYQRGEDGLVKALRKCSSLEQKLQSRDKQIQALVMELNSMHEIAQENELLRKRLNIPDDMVILTKNLAAKERSKDKMINRLTLKLRASEEMRLQLKMEKSDLRTELFALQKQLQRNSDASAESIKLPSNESAESVKLPSEVGEVGEVGESAPQDQANFAICCNCDKEYPRSSARENSPTDTEWKYDDITAENDTLRLGMLEILEKLRDYDASSEHITIDNEILLRLLHALRKQEATPTTANTAIHLQNELENLKLRQKALQELLEHRVAIESAEETPERTSVESAREAGEVRLNDTDLPLELPTGIDSSTRPTTPNKLLDHSLFPVINLEETVLLEPSLDLEQIRILKTQLVELQVYRQRYEELTSLIGSDGSGLTNYSGDLEERCTQLELGLSKKTNCYDYLREDFDKTLTELKQNEVKHIAEVAELRMEIHDLTTRTVELQTLCAKQKNGTYYSAEEYQSVQRTNVEQQSQLAYMLEHVIAGKIPESELKIEDICTDYGIIRENLQLDYLTMEEYEQHKKKLEEAAEERAKCERKCAQLEGLLEIAQEQIQSQQKLLNDITDNHINLRHLVADLQSTAEDKLVLAKIQRDLDSAKSEVNNLKMERDNLQQRCISLQLDNKTKEQLTAQLNERFQAEHRLKDSKMKFLQKSLYALKEKYAKFTPLIFLTNFIFAYTRFTKRVTETETTADAGLVRNLQQNVEQLLTSKLTEMSDDARNDSESLIKLIRAETQNKLLEEQLSSLQQQYRALQNELTEQRMKSATDIEHWKTIEALFGPNFGATQGEQPNVDTAPKEVEDTTCKQQELSILQKDVATNTEKPVPAERKLSATAIRRKSLVEMVDKNMSPIGSPLKQAQKPTVMDNATQTSSTKEETEKIEALIKEQEPETEKDKENSISVAKSIKKLDAIAQTSFEKHNESFGVQTSLEDSGIHDACSLELMEIEKKLKEAQTIAKERAESLNDTNTQLTKANKELEEIRKQIEQTTTVSKPVTDQETIPTKQEDMNQQAGIIEKTILSFHTLLSEKDKTISKYQDLLQTEREQTQLTTARLNGDIEGLKTTIHNLNYNIKGKDMEILELKTRLEAVSVRRNSKEKLDTATGCDGDGDSGDNSLNEISDEKIEEMFEQDNVSITTLQVPLITINEEPERNEEKQDTEDLKEVPSLLKQIKELTDKASYWENTLQVKQEEIVLLREKLQLYQDRDKSLENATNPEIEHLRLLLEEKDKHINELMATLNNFHDDQQRYINDSTNSTADQISKLASDLTRTETTNKIYHTQVEALRRQLASLTQREKQAREQNQSLRNELIKRPVVSIKTELNARVKNENLQKRIQQLELDLDDAKAQIKRQHILIEAKRAKSASEVSLWEKQKRWQQSAEKYKAKLDETECALEKTRALLHTARNAISRLEKDKQVIEAKLGRATNVGVACNIKCCRMPSCPNLHQAVGTKYTPSESPETYTGASSGCSSPAHSAPAGNLHHTHSHAGYHYYTNNEQHQQQHQHQGDLIEAFKARIELQQRKILAMELEGKGSNALTTELEKLQEKFSAYEAQNIRLEARNLQLQLENDMLRQGDATERLQKRIKHLEDYIIALKEEMAQVEARRELCKCSGIKLNTQTGQSAEQTILSLRHIVEKLRVENKYLKDGRRPVDSRHLADTTTEQLPRLQQMYAEALDKIAALSAELSLKEKCTNCGGRGKLEAIANNDELRFIREQLVKKTQLLQKAKVLLTRAAAKEKVLKEQLGLWKRKCSELQNVPVIEEISE